MSQFNQAYQITLGHEGGYVNDPDDKGGETYKGISRVNWPDWPGWAVIDSIKEGNVSSVDKALRANSMLQEDVMIFYYENYWQKLKLANLSQHIANELFDTAVNQGAGTAVKYFQKALNLLNNNGEHYGNIKEDGGFGARTLTAYRAYMLTADYLKYRSEQRNLKTLLKVLNGLQLMKYIKISEKNESQEKYFYGWVNRV